MKYTAEEVQAIARRLHDDITVADGDALMASDMLTDYADSLERAPGGVPDGWVMVPREPTEAMLDAAMTREDDEPLTDWGKIVPAPHAEIYKAMLAAVPSAPEGESHE